MAGRAALSLTFVVAAMVAPASAQGFPSAGAPGGGVFVHHEFVETYLGSNPPSLVGLARVTPDGRLDAGYGRNGFALTRSGGYERTGHVAVDASGEVLVVLMSGTDVVLRRSSGDARLQLPAGFDASDLAALPGGQLLVGGSVPSPDGTPNRALAVARANRDGTLDPAFGDGGVAIADGGPFNASARAVRVLGDGRIVAGGHEVVVRLTPTGDPDPTFAGTGTLPRTSFGITGLDGAKTLIAEQGDDLGIAVERRLESGAPDPGWGDAGRAAFALDAHDFPTDSEGNPFGERVYYNAADVLKLADGRVLVAATRTREPYDFSIADCGDSRAELLELSADGDLLDQITVGPGAADHLIAIGDGVAVTTSREASLNCGFDPGFQRWAAVARYDDALEPLWALDVRPVVAPPAVTVLAAPPEGAGHVTGLDSRLRFAVAPDPRDTDWRLECAVDGAAFAPCPLELTLRLPEGPHALRVRSVGIHGATSDVITRHWIVNHAAPEIVLGGRPPAFGPRRRATLRFTGSEPATFGCRVDGAPAEPCSSPLRLKGLRNGDHRVKISGMDGAGALAEPVVVRWHVDRGSRLTVRGSGFPLRASVRAPEGTRVSTVTRVRVRGEGGERLRRVTRESGDGDRARFRIRLTGDARELVERADELGRAVRLHVTMRIGDDLVRRERLRLWR